MGLRLIAAWCFSLFYWYYRLTTNTTKELSVSIKQMMPFRCQTKQGRPNHRTLGLDEVSDECWPFVQHGSVPRHKELAAHPVGELRRLAVGIRKKVDVPFIADHAELFLLLPSAYELSAQNARNP